MVEQDYYDLLQVPRGADEAAIKAGDSVQTVTIPAAGHFVFIDPQSDVFPQVRTTVRRLLGLEK